MNNENDKQAKISFWKTMPGIITSVATLITAIVAVAVFLIPYIFPDPCPDPNTLVRIVSTKEAEITAISLNNHLIKKGALTRRYVDTVCPKSYIMIYDESNMELAKWVRKQSERFVMLDIVRHINKTTDEISICLAG